MVLVDFWTYSCINCIRALPYVRAWADKYKDHGLVILGVHAPEFAFEKDLGNVRRAVQDLGVNYPVALDNDYAIWQGFNNRYWPAHYFIDTQGRIRHHHFGEGGYAQSEDVIRQLLTEAGQKDLPGGYVQPDAKGAEAADSQAADRSPETYVGYARAQNFVGGPLIRNDRETYHVPATLRANQWSFDGAWTVGSEDARLDAAGGRIVYRFRGRDLHLVLGPGADGKPVRFRVRIDGKAPGADHGMDTDADPSLMLEDFIFERCNGVALDVSIGRVQSVKNGKIVDSAIGARLPCVTPEEFFERVEVARNGQSFQPACN